MTIIEAMSKDYGLRVVYGEKWLVNHNGLWRVYEKRFHQKHSRVLIETEDEAEAVAELLKAWTSTEKE